MTNEPPFGSVPPMPDPAFPFSAVTIFSDAAARGVSQGMIEAEKVRQAALTMPEATQALGHKLNPPANVKRDPTIRLDAGKPRWGLLMGAGIALLAIIEVLEMGAKKYADNAWMKMPNAYANSKESLYRHLHKVEVYGPLTRDEESGKLDLAHCGCNIIFMLWHTLKGNV